MRVVIDTNVIISGTFFGGKPGTVVDAVAEVAVEASASSAILEEYVEVVEEIARKGYGSLDAGRFASFVEKLAMIEPSTEVGVCRDPDDHKFISYAVDAKALYIVSSDKDLLDIGRYENVEVITAAAFCERYLRGTST